MLHFRTLDVYRCAVALLPKAYSMSQQLDGEMASQPARGSALECGAILDAMTALSVRGPQIAEADALVVRIVSMLTKMIG